MKSQIQYLFANFYSVQNYDLYRKINELKSINQWDKIILLCKNELHVNCDIFILARLMEALCIKNGIDGLSESCDIMNNCNDDMFDKNNAYYERIMLWINNDLWLSVFKNKQFLKNKQKDHLLESIIHKIPDSLYIMKEKIYEYIKTHSYLTIIDDIDSC